MDAWGEEWKRKAERYEAALIEIRLITSVEMLASLDGAACRGRAHKIASDAIGEQTTPFGVERVWPTWNAPATGSIDCPECKDGLPSMNWDKDGNGYTYCPECGRHS